MEPILYRVIVKFGYKALYGLWESFDECQKDVTLWESNVNIGVRVVSQSSEDIEE